MAVLKLTTSNYWHELEALTKEGLPVQLADHLKALVNSHMHHAIPPEPTMSEIDMARIHLTDGIELSDSARTLLYDVMLYVPERGKEQERRNFFKLIPKYPGGRFRYLDQLQKR